MITPREVASGTPPHLARPDDAKEKGNQQMPTSDTKTQPADHVIGEHMIAVRLQ